MKLWLDDVRPPPFGWEWVKTAAQAIYWLQKGVVEEASLDHDLGSADAQTGYEVACWIEAAVVHDQDFVLPKVTIHSANPVGRGRMECALSFARKIYEGRLPRERVDGR